MISFTSQLHYARACTCDFPKNVLDEYNSSYAVFLGNVIESDLDGFGKSDFALIEVVQSWKNIRSTRVCLSSAFPCILTIFDDDQLLVYATMYSHLGNQLIVDMCDRTGRFEGALNDVDILDDLGITSLILDGPVLGNFDGDAFLELTEFSKTLDCISGPCPFEICDHENYLNPCCAISDSDDDGDVDLRDIAAF